MNLLRAASTVSLLTLVSRVTGLVRDTTMAAFFGAGALTDAFNVAFRIPNLLRRLFAEGAFSQAFVPILAGARARDGADATRHLVDAVATVLLWVLVVVCAAGVALAPAVVWAMASGLERFDAAVAMTRWMFPYIGCMSLVALAAGVLNTWGRFVVPAATPVLLNLSVIAAAWGLASRFAAHGIEPIQALAVGVMAGGVLQLAVQLPALARIGMLPRLGVTPRRAVAAWRHPGVQRVLGQMAPAVLGVSVAQVSLLVNTQIASHVGTGAVSWLFFADRLMEFPTGLLGVALGVVLLPQLSAAQGRGDAAAYSALLDWGLRLTLLFALPCAVALLVFPQPLVAVLFHYGAFDARDVAQTVRALRGYGVGLVGLIGVKVLAPGFYASQDIRTPVRIGIGVLLLTQLLNALLVPWLGHAGLALSISIAALVNALLLLAGLRRRAMYVPAPGWGGYALRIAGATAAMGVWLAWAAQAVDWVALARQPALRVAWLAAALGVAAAVYFGTAAIAGVSLKSFARRA